MLFRTSCIPSQCRTLGVVFRTPTDPHWYVYLPGSAGAQKSGGVGSQTRRAVAPDTWNFEGPRVAETQRDAVPDRLPVRPQRSRTEDDRHRLQQALILAVQRHLQ